MTTISTQVLDIMANNHLTRDAFAAALGVDNAAVGHWVKGSNGISQKIRDRIKEVYSVEITGTALRSAPGRRGALKLSPSAPVVGHVASPVTVLPVTRRTAFKLSPKEICIEPCPRTRKIRVVVDVRLTPDELAGFLKQLGL